MSSYLDKTITLRQLLRWSRRLLYLAVPLYVVAIFLNEWGLKMGGVGLNNSPYKDQISAQCLEYAERSFGTPPERTWVEMVLFRDRVRHHPIEGLVHGPNLNATCLAYAVLGGLHDKTAGDANFIEQWVDGQGESIVTVRVEFNKPYQPETGSKK